MEAIQINILGRYLVGKDKNLRVYIYLPKDKSFNYGDIIKVEGEIKLPNKARNDKGFDYSKYLKTKRIVASFYVEKVEFTKQEKDLFSKLYDLKQVCINILENNFEKDKAEVLKALLLGDKSDISEETSDIFSKSNLSHILAISGLHITYITLYIEMVLKKVINSIKLRNIIMILFLILFMMFVGASQSAMRACIMAIMYYIAKTLLRQQDFYISFAVSLFIILFINPYNIFSISMWLSFLGTLGIVLFSRTLQKLVQRKFKIKLEIITVSISAQILIFPIMWKNFGTVSLNFWISNLLTSRISSSSSDNWISFDNFIPNKKYNCFYRKCIARYFFKNSLNFFENTF